MKHILVFGSLRQHSERGYNFNRFGGQKFVKFVTLKGYNMFDLGSYPAITEGKGTIKCELHTITDDAFENIQRMEKGAGYTEKVVEVEGVKASIYLMSPDNMKRFYSKAAPYSSGDWN